MHKHLLHIYYPLWITFILITICLLSCSKSATEPDVPADEGSTIPLVFSPMAGWNDFTHEGSDTTKASGLVNNSTDLQNYSISLLANAIVFFARMASIVGRKPA